MGRMNIVLDGEQTGEILRGIVSNRSIKWPVKKRCAARFARLQT